MTKQEAAHLSDVLKAYSEGKEIEHLRTDGVWDYIGKDPTFTEGPLHYRIKPDPKYRPYEDSKEFLKAQKEHGPYLEKIGEFYLPTSVRHDGVLWGFCTKWKELLTYYKWQDGTSCGILEE